MTVRRTSHGWLIVALVVLIAAGGALLVLVGMQVERVISASRTPASPADVRVVTSVPTDAEAAIVDRVIDGDTVRVIAEPHGSIPRGGSIRVRLLNIDAPELARDSRPAECGAHRATAALEALIGPGELVWLVADVEDRDVFDRPLRAMWTEDGTFVNATLVAQGWAQVVLYPPNDRFYTPLLAYESEAQADGRGVWVHCAMSR